MVTVISISPAWTVDRKPGIGDILVLPVLLALLDRDFRNLEVVPRRNQVVECGVLIPKIDRRIRLDRPTVLYDRRDVELRATSPRARRGEDEPMILLAAVGVRLRSPFRPRVLHAGAGQPRARHR